MAAPPDPVAERLARLAPDQRAAAMAPPGPVLCVAPAGSGKTTTVVARLAWRVAQGTDPASICALTFNRRAAEELQERADSALAPLGCPPGTVRARTFHALGREILAEAGVDVTRIVDRLDVLTAIGGSLPPAPLARRLDDAFTRLKLDPERGPPAADVATHRAYADYQAWLAQHHSLDLDDLVARARSVLAAEPALLAGWRRRTAVLFIDEAQDLDRTQLELALLLAGERRDVFLVGDDDQTIYAWRLADVRRVLDLAARLPGLRRVDLETNHRCAPEIVRRAARLVSHNHERFHKRILASPRTSGSVTLAPDPGDEVARARRLLSGWAHGHPGEGHAVLARTNRELLPYAAVALEQGMPCLAPAEGLWLDDPDLISVLEAARRDLPPLVAVARAARAHGLDVERSGALLAWTAPFQDLDRLRHDLASRARTLRQRASGTDALTLATAHGTKGLEWDHVACVGLDDGAFPSARALREAADRRRVLEEERRLAYVAWTRARKTLTLLFDPGAPSRFLQEAFDPAELAAAPSLRRPHSPQGTA